MCKNRERSRAGSEEGLETIFKEKSVFSGEANGGIGGLIFTLVGDSLGGRLGGFSS